jgi:hypothetical protein
MTRFLRRLCAGSFLLFPFILLVSGCNLKSGPKPGTKLPVLPLQEVSQEPGEIELSDPRVTFREPNTVQFEVKYRFTRGRPDKYYSFDIDFPGTKNHGIKTMSDWELKPEGVIKDSIELRDPGAKTFEIYMSETMSPQLGYKKNSNVVKGQIQ